MSSDVSSEGSSEEVDWSKYICLKCECVCDVDKAHAVFADWGDFDQMLCDNCLVAKLCHFCNEPLRELTNVHDVDVTIDTDKYHDYGFCCVPCYEKHKEELVCGDCFRIYNSKEALKGHFIGCVSCKKMFCSNTKPHYTRKIKDIDKKCKECIEARYKVLDKRSPRKVHRDCKVCTRNYCITDEKTARSTLAQKRTIKEAGYYCLVCLEGRHRMLDQRLAQRHKKIKV